ncbi:MAG: TonB family protein [Deltaproteobacteria bacterium]|nr:TonB family protein [Deltaproteobacteria bacterium]
MAARAPSRLALALAVIACSAGVLAPSSAAAQPAAEITLPRVKTRVDARLPPGVTLAEDAQVELLVRVEANGEVGEVTVAISGGAIADAAAIDAVRRWTFEPATRAGAPLASRVRVPLHVAASEPASPATPAPTTPAAPAPATPAPAAPAPRTAAAAPSSPDPSGDAEEVLVVGQQTAPSRGASDFNLRLGELARVPRANAADILRLAPGILLTNKGGEGHAEQVFLRGFDAREGQDIEFTAGGVPINEAGNLHGNGYADLHFILPELVRGLRVIEGPFDPRQGNFAVAGSAAYDLGLDKRGITAKATAGSFGTRRLLLTWGPREMSARTFGGAELYSTSGFGENRSADRATAMGQYEGKIGKNATYRIGATAYSTHYDGAGVLRADDVDAGRVDFYGTYDRRQGGDSSRYSTYGDIEARSGDTRFKQGAFLVFRSMRLRENFTGFLLDTQKVVQSPHPQRGDLLDLSVDTVTYGARGSASWKTRVLDQPQTLEVGYFARGDSTASTQARRQSLPDVPYMLETDLDARLGNIGLYADADLRLARWLGLRGGFRGDLFTYDVKNNCAVKEVRQPSREDPPGDASCLSQQDLGRYREPTDRTSTSSTVLLPRGSLLVGPFESFTFSASVGRGARSIDPIFINQDKVQPFAGLTAYELGVAYGRRISDLDLMVRSVFFQTQVERDLIFNETVGRNVLSQGTTRTGWVGAVRATAGFLDQAANVTLVRSTFDDTGLLIPYVPDVVIRSDTAVHGELPIAIAGKRLEGALAAGITHVGRRALPFGQRSGTIFTVDVSATVAYRGFELGLVSTNLFDQRYRLSEFNFVSDFRTAAQPTLVPARHFSAGAPRGVFLTLAYTFGGGP